MRAAEDTLLAAAEHYDKVTTDPEVLFFYTDKDDEDDITSSLRSLANLPTKNPLLVLINIPAQKQYTCEADVVVQKDVQDLLEGYEKNTIEGKSLRPK